MPPRSRSASGSPPTSNTGPDRPSPYRARVRWTDPATGRRLTLSEGKATEDDAHDWIKGLKEAAQAGLSPDLATMTLTDYGNTNMPLALRGLELKTHDPYLAGWRRRVVPALGHLPVRMITNGAVDRTVHTWIADELSRSVVKNSFAVLVRVMEQAVRDGLITLNPARGEAVLFAACTAARIGEVSGVRAGDIDPRSWIWTVRRQTTPAPGGLTDKATKGKRARKDPLIEEIRPLVAQRLLAAGPDPDARLFTGPRGGRISTAVLRDATHWDTVVTHLGYEHLRRHDLRHTGLTWLADAGVPVPVHVLRKIAGHGSLITTQHYLHSGLRQITDAGAALTAHLTMVRAPKTLPTLPAGPRRAR
ncbi:tyrosine recombinase XerC [Streptomyces sp. CRN 30]|uniref:site-specific integrase n=1 Tax=Streptomyces sp. CRN 30 TaxID=3075613 RepID=UPI002A81C798|nr:tyrosine-type recombinase/integrase [Streptomyces sp. CRN 30]